MGCRQSRYFGGLTNEDLPSSSKASLVMSFHSSARWQLHFDSCKESSQLDVAKEFEVQATPTFVLVKRGKEVDRVVGAKKDELQKKIQKHRAS
ncbi:hypothetical protein JRO89_XS12G0098800 [Xanthoceras sorbifolium]|uniref:Thioredoxin domain-containing protein n=1 Tax=Xanthoceras sorbifolium TaxID=99658 RepID=A0ABQ8HBZ9_9ROSI|nr:hypothetical protein JRO89_XS12G0098800 [Xanthoceras sorbifolium]